MDALAFTIAKEVNNLHMQGNDRYGNPGILFFDILEGPYDASSNIKINDSIQADVGKITAGYSENGPAAMRARSESSAILQRNFSHRCEQIEKISFVPIVFVRFYSKASFLGFYS